MAIENEAKLIKRSTVMKLGLPELGFGRRVWNERLLELYQDSLVYGNIGADKAKKVLNFEKDEISISKTDHRSGMFLSTVSTSRFEIDVLSKPDEPPMIFAAKDDGDLDDWVEKIVRCKSAPAASAASDIASAAASDALLAAADAEAASFVEEAVAPGELETAAFGKAIQDSIRASLSETKPKSSSRRFGLLSGLFGPCMKSAAFHPCDPDQPTSEPSQFVRQTELS